MNSKIAHFGLAKCTNLVMLFVIWEDHLSAEGSYSEVRIVQQLLKCHAS